MASANPTFFDVILGVLGRFWVIGAHPSKKCYRFVLSFWFRLWFSQVMGSGYHGLNYDRRQVADLLTHRSTSADINQTGDDSTLWLRFDCWRLLSDLAAGGEPSTVENRWANRGICLGQLNEANLP